MVYNAPTYIYKELTGVEIGSSIGDVSDELKNIDRTLMDEINRPLAEASSDEGEIHGALIAAKAAQDSIRRAENLAASPPSDPTAAAQREAEIARLRREAQGQALMAVDLASRFTGIAASCSSTADQISGRVERVVHTANGRGAADAAAYSQQVKTFANEATAASAEGADLLPTAYDARSEDFNSPVRQFDKTLNITNLDCLPVISATHHAIGAYVVHLEGGGSPDSYVSSYPSTPPPVPTAYSPQPTPQPVRQAETADAGLPAEPSVAYDNTEPPPFEVYLPWAQNTPKDLSYEELVDFLAGDDTEDDGSEPTDPDAYKGTYRPGPLSKLVHTIQNTTIQHIQNVRSDLGLPHIDPGKYQSPDVIQTIRGLSPDQRWRLKDIAEVHSDALIEIGEKTQKEDQNIIFPDGLLAIPPSIRGEDSKSCRPTVFRMIYQGITGRHIPEEHFSNALKQAFGSNIVHNEQMLNALHSKSFERQYGQEVTTFSFTGMTLERIGKIAQILHEKKPGVQIHVALNIQSSGGRSSTLHAIALTGVSRNNVHFHDPINAAGSANRAVQKYHFFRRWAKAYNSGYMVISKPIKTGE